MFFVIGITIILVHIAVLNVLAQDTNLKPVLTLTSTISEMPIYMSAEIQFELSNPTDKKIIGIEELYYSMDGGVSIYIEFEGKESKIRSPTLELIQRDSIGTTSFDLDPGQTANNRVLLCMEWGNKPYSHLFSKPGLYTIYGTHSIPGYSLIRSNNFEILVRQPDTTNESEAVSILKNGNNLVFFNEPQSLEMEDDPNLIINTVQSIKTIFEMNPPASFKEIAREGLLYWRQIEIDTIKYDIKHMKRRGFDRLGLIDLNLEE